ncbi:kinase-like protein [Anaeromyces robustus]|uniref:non-specific serine/threonine protein kinase n=1 Tax=Anaeromyces robustus TaxID=1754192 RepID=A0A1Y1XM14_9FUNG|nr:kinase-like protein [Anaeromyces robustus]|eukprot:ORX86743.1 kinase-like protein [Anaeromyces robustus]
MSEILYHKKKSKKDKKKLHKKSKKKSSNNSSNHHKKEHKKSKSSKKDKKNEDKKGKINNNKKKYELYISKENIIPNDNSKKKYVLRNSKDKKKGPSLEYYDVDNLDSSSSEENEVSESIKEEIRTLLDDIPELKSKYQILNKTGEGTFSSVYKALRIDEERKRKERIKKKKENKYYAKKIKGKKYYALKRIYATSSPQRIENEISILHDLRKKSNIVSIYGCVRYEDQVILVLPYIQHNDFRNYFNTMTMNDIRYYMISILTALKHCHELYIMHRDIKPSNFLYDVKNRTGVLVDFGLAQRMDEAAIKSSKVNKRISHINNSNNKRPLIESNNNINSESFNNKKLKTTIRANRAGTRGFRAPEVLFKCVHQTVAIDVWSVGVILLSIFSQRFPFFNSNDDYEALLELGCIFGRKKMKYVAYMLERTYETNIPSIQEKPLTFKELVYNLNPDMYIPNEGFDFLSRLLTLDPKTRITAKDALKHPFLVNFDKENNSDNDELNNNNNNNNNNEDDEDDKKKIKNNGNNNNSNNDNVINIDENDDNNNDSNDGNNNDGNKNEEKNENNE